jgi:two-component system sensor histidine kinase RstB
MTRLFLRFYLGVIAILVAAWLIQTYVFRQSSIEENLPVVEDLFASSARLARDQIMEGGEERFPETMEYLQSRFDYPIRVISRTDRQFNVVEIERLDRGEVVLAHFGRLETAIPGSQFLVELGPLPEFDRPSQTELAFALGMVFVLAAAGIAVLLRPVMVQLRGVEKTALAIAGGDLSARIDHQRFRHSAPLAGAFNAMADRVESLLRSQRELLQTVSHELRTPLARIKFATELIQTADDADSRKQRLDAIDDATDRLDDLVGELLTYVRLDADRSDDDAPTQGDTSIETDDLVDEQIELHSPLYGDIYFTTEIPAPGPVMYGDRAAIARAIGNLISNAGKYAKSKVIVSLAVSGNQIHFAVDDDGPGIPEEDRESIFEPFKRLSNSDGRSTNRGGTNRGGTGLGLALVKRIAERNGGRVRIVASQLGGSRFVLVLPVTVKDIKR